MSSSGKGSLSYGLNNKKRKKGGLTGFADDSSSSDDDAAAGKTGPLSGRSAMNREIAAEQAALRKRAEAAMASSSKMDSAVFDYDGEYDSFASGNKKETKTQQREPAGKGQSRYVSNLLQSAQRRSQEQEIIYERKVVKEQAEEKEFDGKEKFITSAYKKKLAEREAWAEEEERAKREAEDDVTNKKGGSFLYGFSRNVLMGVNDNKKDDKSTSNVAHKDDALDTASGRKEESTYTDQQSYQRREYSRQPENPALPRQRGGANNFSRNPQPSEGIGNTKAADETKQPLTRSQILAERAVKIREARERYFKRQGLPNQ